MDIDELCRALETELGGSRGFVNNRVDIAECRRLIREIREKLQPFTGGVNSVFQDRGAILANADGVAKNVLKIAEERAARLVGDSEIVKNAQLTSRRMIDDTYKECDALVLRVKDRLDEIIGNAEDSLRKALDGVSACRYAVKSLIIEAGRQKD